MAAVKTILCAGNSLENLNRIKANKKHNHDERTNHVICACVERSMSLYKKRTEMSWYRGTLSLDMRCFKKLNHQLALINRSKLTLSIIKIIYVVKFLLSLYSSLSSWRMRDEHTRHLTLTIPLFSRLSASFPSVSNCTTNYRIHTINFDVVFWALGKVLPKTVFPLK